MAEQPEKTRTAGSAPASRASSFSPRFGVDRTSWSGQFISNLKDFLTERPARLPRQPSHGAFTDPGFGDNLIDNLKEWFRGAPPAARRPIHSGLLVEVAAKPAYRVFWEDIRDAVAPRKLPALKLSSKPVPVKEIWSKDEIFGRAQALSLLTHALVAILLIVPLLPKLMGQPTGQAKPVTVTSLDLSPYLPLLPPGNKKAGGGGGGGEHNPIPASKGRLPKFSWTQYTPPAVRPPLNPKLPMPATVLGPPDLHLPSPNMPNYGDPLAKLVTDSSGPGGGSGIGTGCCGGVGSGNGGGVGPGEGWGTGGGAPGAGRNGYGEPVCIYCPSPTFSDEAVKAKYQGSVLLRIVVTSDGRATNIEVVRGLGVGLDEHAVETVRTWRFKPALGPNGKPSTVSMLIEVTYRLL
jgi:protein TonB